VVSFTPRPLYPRGNSVSHPQDRKLYGPRSRSGTCEVEYLLPLPEIEHVVTPTETHTNIIDKPITLTNIRNLTPLNAAQSGAVYTQHRASTYGIFCRLLKADIIGGVSCSPRAGPPPTMMLPTPPVPVAGWLTPGRVTNHPFWPQQTAINPIETDIGNARHTVIQSVTKVPVLWVL
jgi:hypothetical protein